MTADDRALARRLTSALRDVVGVREVLPTAPILHAAIAGVSAPLDVDEPEVLVEISRPGGTLTVTAHIATATSRPTPETMRAAARALRGLAPDARVVVTTKIIEPAGAAADAADAGAAASSAASSAEAG